MQVNPFTRLARGLLRIPEHLPRINGPQPWRLRSALASPIGRPIAPMVSIMSILQVDGFHQTSELLRNGQERPGTERHPSRRCTLMLTCMLTMPKLACLAPFASMRLSFDSFSPNPALTLPSFEFLSLGVFTFLWSFVVIHFHSTSLLYYFYH